MCGILFYTQDFTVIPEKGVNRGPDNTQSLVLNGIGNFIFHRLSINGLNEQSNQPFTITIDDKQYILMCNGEIYNYSIIYHQFGITPYSNSDCEVIIHLFHILKDISLVCQCLDGVFAFILLELNENDQYNIHIGRDPFGVRPLYYKYSQNSLIVSSELKMIQNCSGIKHFQPGTTSSIVNSNIISRKYYSLPNIVYNFNGTIDSYKYELNYQFTMAVEKRMNCSDSNIIFSCLLSGGLDSTSVAVIANKIHLRRFGRPIKTYSIGLPGSEDCKFARIAADFIGTDHTEIIISKEEACSYIDKITAIIESPCVTSNRASLMNYLVCLKMDNDPKIVLNGDGADELLGGYLYFTKADNDINYELAIRESLTNIHQYDVLRSDKSISSTGREPRTPFLDKSFVNYVLSIPTFLRRYTPEEGDGSGKSQTKYIFRKAMELEETFPREILWRRKEAFSDGVSLESEPFYLTLQKYIVENFCDEYTNSDSCEREFLLKNPTFLRLTEESYYQSKFDALYSGSDILPNGKWMPKFVSAVDPSAKTLDLY